MPDLPPLWRHQRTRHEADRHKTPSWRLPMQRVPRAIHRDPQDDIFERSKIPLTKWLAAPFLLTASKKGMSSHQMHRMLGISYKSTWFMTHRLREAMRVGNL